MSCKTIIFSDSFSFGLFNTRRIEVGAVWYKRRAHLESFNVTFTVRMSNLSHTGVGNPDGFALVVQNHRGTLGSHQVSLGAFCTRARLIS
jgi:hypothetical protein